VTWAAHESVDLGRATECSLKAKPERGHGQQATDQHGSPQTTTQINMAKTVADFLFERLSAWGVHRVYGYPGDGITIAKYWRE
jgi:hypothetical protein